jgi:hypothetical protein
MSAGGWCAPVFALVMLLLIVTPVWTILRRMGLTTTRTVVYMVLAAIPFAQLWVLWDLARQPWPGQPEGIAFVPEGPRRRVERDDLDE